MRSGHTTTEVYFDLQFSFWFSPHNKRTCIIEVMPARSKFRTQRELIQVCASLVPRPSLALQPYHTASDGLGSGNESLFVWRYKGKRTFTLHTA